MTSTVDTCSSCGNTGENGYLWPWGEVSCRPCLPARRRFLSEVRTAMYAKKK